MAIMPTPIGAVTEEGEMHVLRVNGYDIAYVEHGAGTPLLLIHGSLLDQRYWAPQMEAPTPTVSISVFEESMHP